MFTFLSQATDADWLSSVTTREAARTMVLGPSGYPGYVRVLQLPDPSYQGQREFEQPDAVFDEMLSDPDLVATTLTALAPYTSTPDDLRFLLWEGYPYDPDLPVSERVELAGLRSYALARGTLSDWLNWTEAGRESSFAPGFVFPSDRAWCFAFDVDSHFAGVACSREAALALAEAERLTTVPSSWSLDCVAFYD